MRIFPADIEARCGVRDEGRRDDIVAAEVALIRLVVAVLSCVDAVAENVVVGGFVVVGQEYAESDADRGVDRQTRNRVLHVICIQGLSSEVVAEVARA